MKQCKGALEKDSEHSSPVQTQTESRDVVLVGFAESLPAPEVVWSLVDSGFQVVAFARRGHASALRYSRHVVCHEVCPPELDYDRSLSDISSLLASLGGNTNGAHKILFPLDDIAVLLCSALQLKQPWLLAGPQNSAAELALNKSIQFQAACDAGFDVPKAVLANTAEEIYRFSASVPFPIILKPSNPVPIQNGSVVKCATWICANRAELDRAVGAWGARVPLLIQEYITGTGEGIFGLAGYDGVRAWSAHRRLRMMNPQGSGASACVSIPVSDDDKAKAKKLIERAGWHGLFMIELLRDHAGKIWFVELNGRTWGSMALARRQRLEYPAWQVKLAIDPQSDVGTTSATSPGLVCRHIGREILHILFVMKGPKSKALANWPPFWKSLREILSVHRRDGIYNFRLDDLKVFLADCYYTVYETVFKS